MQVAGAVHVGPLRGPGTLLGFAGIGGKTMQRDSSWSRRSSVRPATKCVDARRVSRGLFPRRPHGLDGHVDLGRGVPSRGREGLLPRLRKAHVRAVRRLDRLVADHGPGDARHDVKAETRPAIGSLWTPMTSFAGSGVRQGEDISAASAMSRTREGVNQEAVPSIGFFQGSKPCPTTVAPTPVDARVDRWWPSRARRGVGASCQFAPTAIPLPSGRLIASLAMLFVPLPPMAPAAEVAKPLDVREPPFGEYDYAWMNGSNPQPASLLGMGPVTWSLYVDTYYAWQTYQPVDHTIFPTTTAPRHDEISLNLAHIGVDVTGLDGPTGRLYLQYGSIVETIAGQDTTTTRGFFLTNRLLQYVAAGRRRLALPLAARRQRRARDLPVVHRPRELPARGELVVHARVPRRRDALLLLRLPRAARSRRSELKVELWVVNGWQTFGQWHEGRAGGYLWNWRPNGWLSLVNSVYAGQEAQGDPDSLRVYSDNNLQVRYFHANGRALLRSMAFSLVGDIGYEHRGDAPSGPMGGMALAPPLGVDRPLEEHACAATSSTTRRRPSRRSSPSARPTRGWAPTRSSPSGVTATLDYWPSPWLADARSSSRTASPTSRSSAARAGSPARAGELPATPQPRPPFTPDLRRTDDRLLFNVTLRL